MTQHSLRRNKRTIGKPAGMALLALSACMFLGGGVCLSRAYEFAHVHALPTDAVEQTQGESSAQESQSDGAVGTNALDDEQQAQPKAPEALESAGQTAVQDTSNGGGASQDSDPPEDSNTIVDTQQPPSASGGQRENSGSSSQQPTAKRTKVIHHTAYTRTEVYRTVHHKASTPLTNTVDGKEVTTWSFCPVCGKRHKQAYDERVLDHYTETFCESCGGRHSHAYDETVMY